MIFRKSMYKPAMFIMVILVVLALAISAHAVWVVHSSFDLNSENTESKGITTNGTSTEAGDIWVVDQVDRSIYHYRPDGTFVDQFSTAGITENAPLTVWINRTPGDNYSMFFTTTADNIVFIMNRSNATTGNFSLATNGLADIAGLESNNTNSKIDTFFILQQNVRKLNTINVNDGINSSCSLASFAGFSLVGLATNSSENPTDNLYLTDDQTDSVFRIDNTCKLLETIDIGDLGIGRPRGIATLFRNAPVNDLLIADSSSEKMFRITQKIASTSFQNQIQNETAVKMQRQANLSVEISTAIGNAVALLATNESGTLTNFTNGRHGSPKTLSGDQDSFETVSFIWTNEVFGILNLNQSIGWQISFNDTIGNENQTAIFVFNATPMVLTVPTANTTVSDIEVTSFNNITMKFNNTQTVSFDLIVPSVFRNVTFSDCAYVADFGQRIRTGNATVNPNASNPDFCNVTFFLAEVNTTGDFKLGAEVRLLAVLPSNIPAAIAGGIIFTFIVVYLINIRRKQS